MRIVGGKYRGHRLATPKSDRIRPTTDRTRESLFNILANRIDYDNLRVIDLFSGTGALGLEAISRGASYCLFVEQSAQGRALLQTNIETLNLHGNTRQFRRDATSLGECGNMAKFDLAFLDPPYGKGLGQQSMECLRQGQWLNPDALVILEESNEAAPKSISGFLEVDRRKFGDTVITLWALEHME